MAVPDLPDRVPLPSSPASRHWPSSDPHDEQRETYYLPPRILTAVRREAATHSANGDWATYAQRKLDRELRDCGLPLTDEQAYLLHRYAEVLNLPADDLLALLVAPDAARRERWRRRAVTFVRQHRPRLNVGSCFWMIAVSVVILLAL